jgi:predicted nuclease with TOPRIM domain
VQENRVAEHFAIVLNWQRFVPFESENAVVAFMEGQAMDNIDELRAENTRLKSELGQVASDSSKLKIHFAETSNELQRLKNANDQLVNEVVQATNEVQELKNENGKLKSEFDHASGRLKLLDKATTELENEKIILTNDLAQGAKDKGLLTGEVKRLGAESIVAKHELVTVQEKLDQAKNDIKRLTTAAEDKVPEARKDLIRRFVAIAISVGFATQIVKMELIKHWTEAIEQWPSWWPLWTTIPKVDGPLLETMARLCTSMLVILLAWDWYDRDLRDKPLTRIGRFILDAIIVSAELVLLLSSSDPRLWAIVLIAIFAFYIVWDIFSIIDHPGAFGFDDPRTKWRYVPRDVLYTYGGGFAGNPLRRGPAINLTWFLYFLVVLSLLPFRGMHAPFITSLMVILGASLLWCEGVLRSDGKRLIAWWGRIIAFLLLTILYGFLWQRFT